ncbi:ethanolamine kinase [Acrasis kona]|uniref:ethanolamine kinase n=1 Tax=Acrasis kona TaxID=1008807 RepID=A0AAW2YMU3_9EUKA
MNPREPINLKNFDIDIKKSSFEVEQAVTSLCQQLFAVTSSSDCEVKRLQGGTTNQLFLLHVLSQHRTVLVRIFGHKTSDLIDRDAEIWYLLKINSTNPEKVPEVHCRFANGLVYEYITGASIQPQSMPLHYEQIAREMAGWHLIEVEPFNKKENKKPVIFQTTYSWIRQARLAQVETVLELPLTLDEIEAEVKEIEKLVLQKQYPVTFCHNDLTYGNIVYDDEKNHVRFIDYEYCGYNYRGFDLGNHFCEYTGLDPMDINKYPSKEHRRAFLFEYLTAFKQKSEEKQEVTVTEQELDSLCEEADIFALMSNLQWSAWALVQQRHSLLSLKWNQTEENWYQGYTRTRLQWYLSLKDQMMESCNNEM